MASLFTAYAHTVVGLAVTAAIPTAPQPAGKAKPMFNAFRTNRSKVTQAFTSVAYIDGMILVSFTNGSVWAYPGKSNEFALMHKNDVSAGRFLNATLKPRGGTCVREKTT